MEGALEAMDAEELRSCLRAILQQLDDEHFNRCSDFLLTRAAQAASEWRPVQPPRKDVVWAMQVIREAVEMNYADPAPINECLRIATRAFLAGAYENAHEILAALSPPLFDGEIDLGHQWDRRCAVSPEEGLGY